MQNTIPQNFGFNLIDKVKKILIENQFKIEFDFKLMYFIAPCIIWVSFWNDYYCIDRYLYAIDLKFIFLFLCVSAYFIYKNVKIKLQINCNYIIYSTIIICITLLSRIDALSVSLSGDELYHAQYSARVISYFYNIFHKLPAVGYDQYISNIWHLFDLRHISVVDLSLIISSCSWILLILIFFTCYKYSFKAGLCLLCILGIGLGFVFSSGEPIAHPPLRLLPLFISQTLFGLTNVAFRLPSIIFLIITQLVFFYYTSRIINCRRNFDYILPFLVTIALSFIPTVFHVSEQVEPSIYGFAFFTLYFICVFCILQKRTPEEVFNGLLILGWISAMGILFRQPLLATLFFNAILYLFLIINRRIIFSFSAVGKLLFPFVFIVPYLYTVKTLGHAATAQNYEVIPHLILSISSGIGPMTIINNLTIPWFLLFSFSFLCILFNRFKLALVFVFAFVSLYCFYFNVREVLWGVGRYQAEFVGSLFAALLFISIYSFRYSLINYIVLSCIPFLILSTFISYNRIVFDNNFSGGFQRKIATCSHIDYTSAMHFLKSQENHGRFAIIGVQDEWWGPMVCWLGSMSFFDGDAWFIRQLIFYKFISESNEISCDLLYNKLKNLDIRHIVLTSEVREMPGKKKIIRKLISEDNLKFKNRLSCFSPLGNAVDVYEVIY